MSHAATNWAIQQRGLKPATKIVLWHLCDRHNPDFGCFPTQVRLAEDAEMSISSLNDHLKKLEQLGLIQRIQCQDHRTKRRQATRYILGFEMADPQEPIPEIGDGQDSADWERVAEPCSEFGDGANSDFGAVPSPENRQSHLRNSETNPVREPLNKPVKEEEDAQAREIVDEEFFGSLLAALGCKIDGGQYKMGTYTHEDAEVIAATVAGMPDNLGGNRMAIRVAELARAGLTPDWMPGAVPRCVPLEMKRNRHGDHATTVVVGTERVLSRGKWRTVEVRACPVMFRPDARQIEAARRAYSEWWKALVWVRDGLIAGGMLRDVDVTGVTPKAKPWNSC